MSVVQRYKRRTSDPKYRSEVVPSYECKAPRRDLGPQALMAAKLRTAGALDRGTLLLDGRTQTLRSSCHLDYLHTVYRPKEKRSRRVSTLHMPYFLHVVASASRIPTPSRKAFPVPTMTRVFSGHHSLACTTPSYTFLHLPRSLRLVSDSVRFNLARSVRSCDLMGFSFA